MTFDEWIYKVCAHISIKFKRDVHEIYQQIDLTEAKVLYIDGILPEDVEMQNDGAAVVGAISSFA